MSNATCFTQKAPEQGPPLFENGHIIIQAHDIGWIVTGVFTIIATVVSLWLVNKHLRWYTNKREQRYIVRLLFMVPLYALISFASYLFWNHATPLLLIRDAYESTVLTAFFYLLLLYLSPDADEQKAIFMKVGLSRQLDREARRRGEEGRKWMFPFGFVRWKPEDGLYFLQLMKWGVLQYCVIRPTTTLIAVILNYVGLYCDDSWSLGWGHVWITTIMSISVSVAMYCLLQLYLPIAPYLKPHKPILKLFAVKAVVFLTFWQATLLSLLSMFGVVKDTEYMTADDINIGWGAIIETFEMVLFAFLHIKAFTYKPYATPSPSTFAPPTRFRALLHTFDFRETLRELWAGFLYLADRARGREPRHDKSARRAAVLEGAFGGPRPNIKGGGNGEKIEVEVRRDVEIEGERMWIGLGLDDVYKLERREKSDDFGTRIERELERKRRGLARGAGDAEDQRTMHIPQRSWWRNIYARLSQADADADGDPVEEKFTPAPRRHSRSRSRPRTHSRTHSKDNDIDRRSLLHAQDEWEYDDPPPPSTIRAHRARVSGGLRMPSPLDIGTSSPPLTPDIETPARSDSLLARVFSPGSVSAASLTTQSKSASLHDTRVQVLPQIAAVVTVLEERDGEGEEPVIERGKAVVESPAAIDRGLASDVQIPSPSEQPELPSRPSHRRESAHYRRSFLVAAPPVRSTEPVSSGPVVSLNEDLFPAPAAPARPTPPTSSVVPHLPMHSSQRPPKHRDARSSIPNSPSKPRSENVPSSSLQRPVSDTSRVPRHALTRQPPHGNHRRSSAPLDTLPTSESSPTRSPHRPQHSLDTPSTRSSRALGAPRPSSLRRSSRFSRFQVQSNAVDPPIRTESPRRPISMYTTSSIPPVPPAGPRYARPTATSTSHRPLS